MSLPTTPTLPTPPVENGAHPATDSPRYRGVAMFTITSGRVTAEFAQGTRAMLLHDAMNQGYITYDLTKTGIGLSVIRNAAVDAFLNDTDAEWMLNLDDDIMPEPDTLDVMMRKADAYHAPLISGLYLTTLDEGLVGCAWGKDDVVLDQYALLDLINDGVLLHPILKAGAGALLVHRTALEQMHRSNPGDPWFGEPIIDGVRQGEDFAFFLRARDAGIPAFLDLEVNLGHVKTIVWNKAMLGNVNVEVADGSRQGVGVTP